MTAVERLCAELAADAVGTSDAWVVLAAAASGIDRDLLLRCVEGREHTLMLEHGLAADLVERLDDSERATAIIAVDQRPRVLAAATTTGARMDLGGERELPIDIGRTSIADLADRLADELNSRTSSPGRVAATITAVAAGDQSVTDLGHDDHDTFDAVARILFTLSRRGARRDVVARLRCDELPAAATAAVLCWGAQLGTAGWALPVVTHRQVLDATAVLVEHAEEFWPWRDTHPSVSDLIVLVARAAMMRGVALRGPDSLIATVARGGELGVDDADPLVQAAVEVGRCDLVDELLDELTRGGTRIAPLPSLDVSEVTDRMSPDVFACACPHPADLDVVEAAAQLSSSDTVDPDALLDALDRHRPDLADELLAALPRIPDGSAAPTQRWRDTSMSRHGLAEWVALRRDVRHELLEAGAHLGVDGWAVVVALLSEFRGTPRELVDVAAAAAPGTPPL
jgi:hypothetical protein